MNSRKSVSEFGYWQMQNIRAYFYHDVFPSCPCGVVLTFSGACNSSMQWRYDSWNKNWAIKRWDAIWCVFFPWSCGSPKYPCAYMGAWLFENRRCSVCPRYFQMRFTLFVSHIHGYCMWLLRHTYHIVIHCRIILWTVDSQSLLMCVCVCPYSLIRCSPNHRTRCQRRFRTCCVAIYWWTLHVKRLSCFIFLPHTSKQEQFNYLGWNRYPSAWFSCANGTN